MSFNALLPKSSIANTQLEKLARSLFPFYASTHSSSVIENDRCACKKENYTLIVYHNGTYIYTIIYYQRVVTYMTERVK